MPHESMNKGKNHMCIIEYWGIGDWCVSTVILDSCIMIIDICHVWREWYTSPENTMSGRAYIVDFWCTYVWDLFVTRVMRGSTICSCFVHMMWVLCTWCVSFVHMIWALFTFTTISCTPRNLLIRSWEMVLHLSYFDMDGCVYSRYGTNTSLLLLHPYYPVSLVWW